MNPEDEVEDGVTSGDVSEPSGDDSAEAAPAEPTEVSDPADPAVADEPTETADPAAPVDEQVEEAVAPSDPEDGE